MVIYLPTQSLEDAPALDELTPREIVRELDKYVVGQSDAKRAVAVACATASAGRSSILRWRTM